MYEARCARLLARSLARLAIASRTSSSSRTSIQFCVAGSGWPPPPPCGAEAEGEGSGTRADRALATPAPTTTAPAPAPAPPATMSARASMLACTRMDEEASGGGRGWRVEERGG